MDYKTIFQETRSKINALGYALSVINYDNSTIAPVDGGDYRNEMASILSNQYFNLSKDPHYIQAIEQLLKQDNEEDFQRELQFIYDNYLIDKDVPSKLQQEYSKNALDSFLTWVDAKEKNDYALFEPALQKVITTLKKVVSYYPIQNKYDALLNLYCKGLTTEKLDEFFDVIQKRLVPFIQKIMNKQVKRPDFLSRPVPIDKQKEVTEFIRNILLFPKEKTYIGESAHPFSSTFSRNDARITTKYVEDLFTSNIFSIIHEIGHGTYELQINPKYDGWSTAGGMSMSMHESQSRFLENNIGRHPSFWKPYYADLQKIVAPVLDDVSFDDFIFGINYSTLSLIRTEADELTYPLHILVRYKMEREIILGDNLENLNQRWADYYKEILGLDVDCDAHGILQDVHWSDGSFGYFPTYALGSAYAAQFFEKIQQDLDLEKELENKNYAAIKEWNRVHIHQFGALYTDDEMLNRVTGKSFDANIYCDYLIAKFTKLYQL